MISTNLIADYAYAYLNQLARYHAYEAGARADRGVYTYDALDRTMHQLPACLVDAAPRLKSSSNFRYCLVIAPP